MANNYMHGNIVMRTDDASKMKDFAGLHLQATRKLIITVEVLDENLNTIETLQGLATGGNISISNSSLIRRTGSLSFVLFDYLMPKKQSLLWMTNRIRVYAGIVDLKSSDDSATHFCLGTYYIVEPDIQVDATTRSIQINLEDYMSRWEQVELEDKLEIDAGTPLNTAMYSVMNLFGEFNTNIEFTDLTVPYKLEFNQGDTVSSVITKLRDLYMDWDCYYDVDGTFIFRKMKIQREDGEPVSWSFDGVANLLTESKESFSYKEVRNHIVVIGKIDEETGLTPKAEVKLTSEDSPFHENEIGVRKKVILDSTYSNESQCDSRARYELFKASNMQEKMDLTSIPIYFLDGNDVIEIRNLATNELEKYVIDSISIGLGVSDLMSISCHKLYYDDIESNSSLDEYRAISEVIINGIQNKGWLYLSEQRIKEFYGLEGKGSKLEIRFQHQEKYGATATTTAYTFTDAQSITIDLADFTPSEGENGDNQTSKAEYSDRILGHEMVHVVMNDAMGASKTINLPDWFKEGSAEFIHGADERLKLVIVDENNTLSDDLINALIDRCVELVNGASFEGGNLDYSAGYILLKYIDKKISSGKDMKNFMNSIKVSEHNGIQAITDAIVENTSFSTLDDFIANFQANALVYIKGLHLNIGADETDTGSIAGIDHRGTVSLNAETTFDESRAIEGVCATGFDVEFIRI